MAPGVPAPAPATRGETSHDGPTGVSRLAWPWRAGLAFRRRELLRAAVDARKELGHSWVTAVTVGASVAGKAISDWLTKDGFGVLELTGIALAALLGVAIGWLVLFALRWLLAGSLLADEDERAAIAAPPTAAADDDFSVLIRVGPTFRLIAPLVEGELFVLNRSRTTSVCLEFHFAVLGETRHWEHQNFRDRHVPQRLNLKPHEQFPPKGGYGGFEFRVAGSWTEDDKARTVRDPTLARMTVHDLVSGRTAQLPFPGTLEWKA